MGDGGFVWTVLMFCVWDRLICRCSCRRRRSGRLRLYRRREMAIASCETFGQRLYGVEFHEAVSFGRTAMGTRAKHPSISWKRSVSLGPERIERLS
jgi:hypothetical protein